MHSFVSRATRRRDEHNKSEAPLARSLARSLALKMQKHYIAARTRLAATSENYFAKVRGSAICGRCGGFCYIKRCRPAGRHVSTSRAEQGSEGKQPELGLMLSTYLPLLPRSSCLLAPRTSLDWPRSGRPIDRPTDRPIQRPNFEVRRSVVGSVSLLEGGGRRSRQAPIRSVNLEPNGQHKDRSRERERDFLLFKSVFLFHQTQS